MASVVSLSGVSKSFAGKTALSEVSFEIQAGEILGLLGPNGAGKTTLISAMGGLVRFHAGSISIMGHDVRTAYRQARRHIGIVPQELVFDPFFTVRETLRLQSGYFGIQDNEPWIDHVLERLDLSAKANSNMRTLSGGMKRRVLVAQALVHRPPVIVLDEPTAGVDVELRKTLWDFVTDLNKQGHTILLTTHYLEEAEQLCHRIAMLREGRLIALAPTTQFLAQPAGHVVRLRVQGETSSNAPTEVDVDGWQVHRVQRHEEIAALIQGVVARGGRVVDMQLDRPDLESVFLRVMKEEAPPC